MKRFLATSTLLLALITLSSTKLQADDPVYVGRTPVIVVEGSFNREPSATRFPILDLSTAIPTVDEIRNVPTPQPDDLLDFPFAVLRYGLSIHPTSRVLRHNGFFGLFD